MVVVVVVGVVIVVVVVVVVVLRLGGQSRPLACEGGRTWFRGERRPELARDWARGAVAGLGSAEC